MKPFKTSKPTAFHYCTLLASLGRAMAETSSIPIATPLSLPPTQFWDGNDGPWSSFGMQIGTPAQNLRLLPSTSSNGIWPILQGGCPAKISPSDCANYRASFFQPNESSTWEQIGIYSLLLVEEQPLGYAANASYGYDTIIPATPGVGGIPTIQHQVIAGFIDDSISMGVLGVSPLAINLTNLTDPRPSFVGSLKNQTKIPSSSWGYTAGAYYRQPSAFGSLTLGGYDSERFVPNDISFTFGADQSRDLLAGLQKITTSTTSAPLMTQGQGIYVFLDSLVPELWLPTSVCQNFEAAFGLVYNGSDGLYLVNDTLHSKLTSLNPSVTLTFGPDANGGPSVDVVMEYGSFDLSYENPKTGSKTKYFPLRHAQNSTQYTLGRAFFQAAYVIADYDRRNFSISQTIFPNSSNPSHIVAIKPPGQFVNSTASASSSHGIATGAIAGIVVGVVIGLALIAVAVFFFLRKRRSDSKKGSESDDEFRKAELAAQEAGTKHEMYNAEDVAKDVTNGKPVELEQKGPDGKPVELEQDDKKPYGELHGSKDHKSAELGGVTMMAELEGSEPRVPELSAGHVDASSNRGELPHTDSFPELTGSQPTTSPVSPIVSPMSASSSNASPRSTIIDRLASQNRHKSRREK